jgi:hypothetical protein
MKKKTPAARGGSASLAQTVPGRPTSHRAVVSLALALFVPALWLVLNGNLEVQTALVRFVGALTVSWIAAWLVFSTAHHSTGSPAARGAADGVHASTQPAGTTEPGGPDAPDHPDA